MNSKDLRDLHESFKNIVNEQQLDEFLGAGAQKAVDSATKKIQGGLEKIGVKINRTERGTVTKDQQQKRIQQNNSVDMFELIKGHLMSEGYADTEKAALAIMANMSEDWKESIVEQARSREFEHGSTRSSNTPSGNLSANRSGRGRGSRGPEFEHGSTRSMNTPSKNLGDGLPRDKKGNIMH